MPWILAALYFKAQAKLYIQPYKYKGSITPQQKKWGVNKEPNFPLSTHTLISSTQDLDLSKGCSMAASGGPADVSLSLQIHHHISTVYMEEERANLIYLAVWALQSPKQTSPAASSLHCLPLPNVLSSLSSHLGWVQQRTWVPCQTREMCQRPFKIHFAWQ